MTASSLLIRSFTSSISNYGLGILVDAENNPQMMCYALGALEIYDGIYDIESVRMTIFQPRRENISTYEMDKESLLHWAETILKPTAELAYVGDGEFKAGDHCQFCKAKSDMPQTRGIQP